MRRVVAALLVLGAAALLALVVSATYGYNRTYGFSGQVDLVTTVIVLLVAALAFLLLIAARGALRSARRSTALLAVGVATVFLAGTYAAAVVGGGGYEQPSRPGTTDGSSRAPGEDVGIDAPQPGGPPGT